MSLAEIKINGATSSLNGVLAACVAIMNYAKSEAAWWICLWLVVAVSVISITRTCIVLWIRFHGWWKRRAVG